MAKQLLCCEQGRLHVLHCHSYNEGLCRDWQSVELRTAGIAWTCTVCLPASSSGRLLPCLLLLSQGLLSHACPAIVAPCCLNVCALCLRTRDCCCTDDGSVDPDAAYDSADEGGEDEQQQ